MGFNRRTMRHFAARLVLLFALAVLSGLPALAQNKAACELLSKADAEAVLGVTLQPPKPTAPFRSLLDPDFTSGTPEQGCNFTNFVPNQPKPPKVVAVSVEEGMDGRPSGSYDFRLRLRTALRFSAAGRAFSC
jgi:hypothetical protein